MKSREIEADLAQLYCILPKPKGKGMRDHHRMVLPKILAFDASKFLLFICWIHVTDVAARLYCWLWKQ